MSAMCYRLIKLQLTGLWEDDPGTSVITEHVCLSIPYYGVQLLYKKELAENSQ